MSPHAPARLAIALSAIFALSACDLLDRDRSRDAMWQTELDTIELAASLDGAMLGDTDAWVVFDASRAAIETALSRSTKRSLPSEIGTAWSRARTHADTMRSQRQALVSFAQHAAGLQTHIPQVMAKVDELTRSLLKSKSDTRLALQVHVLCRMHHLLSALLRRAEAMNMNSGMQLASTDGLSRGSEIFETTVIALLDGNEETGMEPISDPGARLILLEAIQLFSATQPQRRALLDLSPAVVEAQTATEQLRIELHRFRTALKIARYRTR